MSQESLSKLFTPHRIGRYTGILLYTTEEHDRFTVALKTNRGAQWDPC